MSERRMKYDAAYYEQKALDLLNVGLMRDLDAQRLAHAQVYATLAVAAAERDQLRRELDEARTTIRTLVGDVQEGAA